MSGIKTDVIAMIISVGMIAISLIVDSIKPVVSKIGTTNRNIIIEDLVIGIAVPLNLNIIVQVLGIGIPITVWT